MIKTPIAMPISRPARNAASVTACRAGDTAGRPRQGPFNMASAGMSEDPAQLILIFDGT